MLEFLKKKFEFYLSFTKQAFDKNIYMILICVWKKQPWSQKLNLAVDLVGLSYGSQLRSWSYH